MGGQGVWYLKSKKDPRWNVHKEGLVSIYSVENAKEKIEELKQLYGDPPDDLEWGFCKE